jgi:hypothetical protein
VIFGRLIMVSMEIFNAEHPLAVSHEVEPILSHQPA